MPVAQTKTEAIWSAREIATIVDGRWFPDLVDDLAVAGVTFRLEEISAGKLFFAASPDAPDSVFPAASKMLAKAAAGGAMGAVVDQQALPQGKPSLPVLAVGNTLDALHALAVAARKRYAGRVAAVTGTVGKTSVCRMIAHVLERQGRTVSNIGRRNYLPGLRAAICSIPPDFQFGVFELNMLGKRTIAPKSRLLLPDVAMITALGLAHLEHHRGNMESVVRTKAGIVDGLRPDGTLILPRDSPWYEMLASDAANRGGTRMMSFGEHVSADVRLMRSEIGPGGSIFDARIGGQNVQVRLTAPGRYAVMNCLAVLAAVKALQGDVDRAVADIADWQAPAGRGRISVLKLSDGDALLIDNSYNANPDSMKAAIELLGMIPPKQNGRRIAVLSDMLELGEISGQCHSNLAMPLVQSGTDRVFTMGQQIRNLRRVLSEDYLAPHCDNVEKLGLALEAGLRRDDVVMIQGSRATGLGEVVERLKALERVSELLIDINERRILYQTAMDVPRFPASLVKLMTLIMIFTALDAHAISLDEKIQASARATHLHPKSSILGLAEGDSLSIEDVIRGLIVQSANDAAICVAERLAGTEAVFVEQMNRTAQALGLRKTSFANAAGEHAKGNQTTAQEIAAIALSIFDRFPHYLHYFAETGFSFKGHNFPPRNRLIRTYAGLRGMKTGHVPASGYHLVALAQRGERRLLSVVMGAHNSEARDQRTTRLLDLGFATSKTEIAANAAVGLQQSRRQDGVPEM